ncbi:MAG: hypothetical protein K2L13_00080 [Opitutales bacterium]|nr:hypothetical protein [Opitutales bacterium]
MLEKELGFSKGTIKRGWYTAYTLLSSIQDIKDGLDAIASINDPNNTKVPSEKFFKIAAELSLNLELREQVSEMLKEMNFDPIKIYDPIFRYVVCVANNKSKTEAYCNYFREIRNLYLVNVLETRQYSGPLIKKESFDKLASNFEKLRDEAFLKFLDEKVSDSTSDSETQAKWENFKKEFAQSPNNHDCLFLNNLLTKIKTAIYRTPEEKTLNDPSEKIFKKLLSTIQEKQDFILNDVDADFGEIYDETNPQKTSGNFNYIANMLARELTLKHLFSRDISNLGPENIDKLATAIGNAYIQKQQKKL